MMEKLWIVVPNEPTESCVSRALEEAGINPREVAIQRPREETSESQLVVGTLKKFGCKGKVDGPVVAEILNLIGDGAVYLLCVVPGNIPKPLKEFCRSREVEVLSLKHGDVVQKITKKVQSISLEVLHDSVRESIDVPDDWTVRGLCEWLNAKPFIKPKDRLFLAVFGKQAPDDPVFTAGDRQVTGMTSYEQIPPKIALPLIVSLDEGSVIFRCDRSRGEEKQQVVQRSELNRDRFHCICEEFETGGDSSRE